MGILDIFRKKSNNVIEEYSGFRQDNMNTDLSGINGEFSDINNALSDISIDENEFKLVVQDVFNITGRGVVIVGKIENGCIKVGDRVSVINVGSGEVGQTTVVGIEQFRKMLDVAYQGDSVGLLLRNMKSKQINKGDIICK